MSTSKKPNEPSTAKSIGCVALMVVFGIAWISSKIPGCSNQNAETTPPSPVASSSTTPTPVPAVILDAYQLLGQSRSSVRKFISSHGFQQSEHYARDTSNALDGDAMDVFQSPAGVDGIEVLATYDGSSKLNHLTIQNLATLKLPLNESERLLPQFGVTGLEAEPEKSPAAWHWQDLRDMNVRTVETAAPSADPNDYIDFLQLRLGR